MLPIEAQSPLAPAATAQTRPAAFPGFAPPTSNTTYTPNQFFDVCIPHYSRGVIRLVGYLIRKVLGWCDAEGNPQQEQVRVTYRELVEKAGVGHSMIRQALDEAVAGHFIRCVQPGKPKTQESPEVHAEYELCWDDREDYIRDPGQFRGFYGGDAHRTDIPNQFFDTVLPHHKQSVIKVVASIIRFSIGFQSFRGRRRQFASLSYKAIQDYTNLLNRQTLSEALRESVEHNFIHRVEEGLFTPDKKRQRASSYALRWSDQVPVSALPFSGTPSAQAEGIGPKNVPEDRSEKRTRSAADRSEKRTRDRSEIRTRIGPKNVPDYMELNETRNETRERKQQQGGNAAVLAAAAVVPNPIVEKLKSFGFDATAAELLATRHSAESIERQLGWFPFRATARNPLGMLRKAIEQDWPEPPAANVRRLTIETPGAQFVRHFYAGYGGNPGTPTAEPAAHEIEQGERYAARLLEVWPDDSQAAEWGRKFGAFVREKNRFNDRAISFVIAARSYGDEFFSQHEARRKRLLAEARQRAQDEHLRRFESEWYRYLYGQEKAFKTSRRREFRAFRDGRTEERNRLASERWITNREEQLAKFDSKSRRLEDFQQFFSREVLDFWDWDTQVNPNSFKEESITL